MKKLLIITLMALLLILTVYTMVSGISIGPVQIPGIKGIIEKNESLDTAIAQANKLADTGYKRKINDLNENVKKLESEKTKYQDLAAASIESGNGTTGQVEKYEIEYLWTKIGNHATREGVSVDMKLESDGDKKNQDIYNLNFTVTGSYIGIEEFISDIENDSSLGFKIEQFSLNGADNNLTGTFICKNIMIENVNKTSLQEQDTTAKNTDTKDSNTTNTTNTTNTNSTNTSNDVAASVINSQTSNTNTNR